MRVISLSGGFPPRPKDRYPADLAIINRYGTSAFLLGDPNPIKRTPSQLPRSYQDFAGTVADTSTQTVALGLDLSEGAAIGADQAVNGGFDADTDWSKATGVTIGSGVCTFTSVSSASGLFQDKGDWTGGELIRLTLDINTLTAGFFRAKAGGNGALVNFAASTGTKTIYLIAGSAAAGRIEILAAGTTSGVIDNVEYEVVAGNHFYQATSADEPTLTYANSQWGYVGDAASKHFKTGLVPASSVTMMAAGVASGNATAFLGSETGANSFRVKSNNVTGRLTAIVGSTNNSTVTASTIVDVPGIVAVRASGSSYNVRWQPIGGDSVETFSGSFSGSIPTDHGIAVLGSNDDGIVDEFFGGTIWRALAQQSAYTDAEIAAIANQWSRELASLT